MRLLFQRSLRSTVRGLALGLVLLLCVLAGTSTPLSGQGSTWSQPYDLGPYWFPDIAVDGADNAHVVWSSGGEGFDTVMYASRAADGSWSPPIDIQAQPAIAGSEATRPTLFVDSIQTLQSTFRDTTIYYSQSPAAGGGDPRNWSTPQAISTGYFSDMDETEDGALHLVYTDNVPSERCPVCYHLYYVRSNDDGNSWSDPVDISRSEAGTAKPQLLVDSLGNLHVVYESGIGGSYGGLMSLATVMYVSSRDGGTTWTAPHEMDPARGESDDLQARNIAVAEGKDGELVVVWWAIPEDTVYYQRSVDVGANWSQPVAIGGVYGVWNTYASRLDIYSMATDLQGTVHLVMAGRTSADSTQRSLLHLSWDGSSWTQPDAIVRYAGDAPEWPRIAIGLGNHLHVVWFVRDELNIFRSDSGRYRVYYSERILDFPGTAPIPLPTLSVAEVLHAQAVPQSADAEVAVLADAQDLDGLDRAEPSSLLAQQNIRSENDDVLLLILAGLPALLIVLFFMGVARKRTTR